MIGENIGPYQVEAMIGRGGMGEVYRARDTKLGREVALKVLPSDLAGDTERLARFDREARLLASLQHQNIASIYGLEEFAGQPVLVMELAEGEDLSLRLASGPLPVDEVEKIARQLARGLEYAHEHGIVHRDLKPANVKLGPDGRIKILDFGLARALAGPGGSSPAAVMSSLTLTRDLTGAGAIVGTAAYMSPEQARGYEVDRRADIWAFGVILYELLTGRQLFAGETASDTLAAILRQEPEWSALPDDTPPVLAQLVRRCLQKDPQLRLRDIGEVRVALEDGSGSLMGLAPASGTFAAVAAPATHGGSRLSWALVAVLALLLVGLGAMGMAGRLGPHGEHVPLVQSEIALPENTTLYLNPASPGQAVVSPDGRRLAFTALDSTGRPMLYLKTLAEREMRVIPGTQGAHYPFWSPDSREVAFFARDHLNRVDISGGPVVPICPADNGKWGSWNRDDIILFAPSHIAPINRVDAAGGVPVPVTDLEHDERTRSHRFPQWLPDGQHFLYLAWHTNDAARNGAESTLRVASLDGTLNKDLMACQTDAIYTLGHLLYAHEGNLMSRPFSLDDLEFTGPPRPLIGGVLTLTGARLGVFSATDAGVLTYVRGGGSFGQSQMLWLDDDGQVEPLTSDSGSLQGFEVSPDGTRVAYSVADPQNGTFDIWIHDVERALATRFTFNPESELYPVWGADGAWIYYSASHSTGSAILRKRVSGTGMPEPVVMSERDCIPDDCSNDGRWLAFSQPDSTGDFDLWLLDLARPDATPQVFRDSPFNEGQASFSPAGDFLTYVSEETGQFEIFVESRDPDHGGRWRISTSGGLNPVWSRDGAHIYYVGFTGELLATRVAVTGGALTVGETATLTSGIETDMAPTVSEDPASGRLIVQKPEQDRVAGDLQLVTGWQNLLVGPDGVN